VNQVVQIIVELQIQRSVKVKTGCERFKRLLTRPRSCPNSGRIRYDNSKEEKSYRNYAYEKAYGKQDPFNNKPNQTRKASHT